MNSKRILLYLILFAVFVASVFIKVGIIKGKDKREVVSFSKEYQYNGKPVDVYRVNKSNLSFYTKVTGNLISPYELVSFVTLSVRSDLTIGQQIIIEDKQKEYFGVVDSISDYPNIDTGLIKVTFAMKNTIKKPIGSFLVAKIRTGRIFDLLKIPNEGIIKQNENEFCWVVKGDRVMQRKISTAETNGVYTKITKGLESDDVVVVGGLAPVKENDKVSIHKVEGI